MRNPDISLETRVYPVTTKYCAETSNSMSSAMADSLTQPFYKSPEAADYLWLGKAIVEELPSVARYIDQDGNVWRGLKSLRFS